MWTIQTHLLTVIEEERLAYTVFHGHSMPPRRSVDLVIVGRDLAVEVASEFKYEPSHQRTDIARAKFDVCEWGLGGIGGDVERVRKYIAEGLAQVGYSILIDEGGHFRHKPAHAGSEWIEWPEVGVSTSSHVLKRFRPW